MERAGAARWLAKNQKRRRELRSRGHTAARMSSENQNSVFLFVAPFLFVNFFSFLPLCIVSVFGGRVITKMIFGWGAEYPYGIRARPIPAERSALSR